METLSLLPLREKVVGGADRMRGVRAAMSREGAAVAPSPGPQGAGRALPQGERVSNSLESFV